ncbi:MAG: phosphomannomutase [uncultured archaeon A07HR60]|nr:MAG: phosphomannomutase [uncultured archaeon A07HR60]
MGEVTFGTDGWRAQLEEFTDERLRMVGQGIADHLSASGQEGAIAVGYDPRSSSEGFAESLGAVFSRNGHDVVLPERDCPTPVVAHAVVERGLAGACMITASHNPPGYNGVKFIPADGAPALPDVTDDIESRLKPPLEATDSSGDTDEAGSLHRVNLRSAHADAVRKLVNPDLSGMTVVYDAMHGAGRGVTDRLLERCGAEVITRRCSRDPEFGGAAPEPNPDTLDGLVEAVRDHDATLGIANDGDADRVAVCTPEGYLDENLLFATLYEGLLEEESGTAVRSVSTTFLVDEVANARGGDVFEVPVGFKWVADAMDEQDALIGGEESGGFSIRGHVREKDGVLAGLLAASLASDEPFEARVQRLFESHGPIHTDRISVDCPDDRKQSVIETLTDQLPETVDGREVVDISSLDGVKLFLADGSWLLIRPSGTEPKLRVYAESSSEQHVSDLLTAGRELLGGVI